MEEKIQKIVDTYFPESQYSEEVRLKVILVCDNIQREINAQHSEMAFKLANELR